MARVLLETLLAVALCAISLTPLSAQAPVSETTAAADAAFDADDYPKASALYDQVLAANPKDLHALLRSAMLLSWDGKTEEAKHRYDRALEADPGNLDAVLGRAKMLSWQGKLDAAQEAYRAVLARSPDNREARLGLARCLSWDGKQRPAREEYETVLKLHPNDADATFGVAQTYAWSGDLTRARQWYEKARAAEPASADPEIGLAYVELWSGNPGAAADRLADLEQRHPGKKEVTELREAVRKARAPSLSTDYDHITDADKNRLDTYRLEAGVGLPAGLRFRVGAARYDMRSPGRTASVDSVYAGLGLTPGRGQSLSLRIGGDRKERAAGDTSWGTVGGVWYTWGLDRRWQISASADRDTLKYSPIILDHDIVIDSCQASVSGAPADRWRVIAGGGAASFSDGNRRRSFLAGATYQWPLTTVTFETGYLFRYLDFSEHLLNGYFDPSGFTAHLLQNRVRRKIGRGGASFEFSLEAGIQSFTAGETKVTNDRVVLVTARLVVPVARFLDLEVYGNHSDYALQNVAGFESDQVGIQLRWRLGG